jgi:hypothetical protein
MTRYAILTDTFCTGWVNCSTGEDGYPLTFDSMQDAENELADHLSNSEDLELEPEDYKIVEITDYDQGYLDGKQGAPCVKPFGLQAAKDYEDGYIQGILQAMEHSTEVTE